MDILIGRTSCGKAGICGVGIFWSRFSHFQLFFLEVLFPFVLVLVRLRHFVRRDVFQSLEQLHKIYVERVQPSSSYEWRSSSPDADFNVLARAEKLLVGWLLAGALY
jgi:hypothetical protein